ncbi:MAG: PEP-CTERM sorting domain-containing protein [Verrucomicrobiota bacterium]
MNTLYKKGVVLALAFAGLMAVDAKAQLAITTLSSTETIDFQSFDGSGFAATPAAGQLDSDTWDIQGFNSAGDLARGASSGGVTTGGVYSFDVGGGNNTLGFQPGGSDFTPGTATLTIQNTTGFTVNSWNFGYDLWVFNDQGRANSFNWEWSTDNVSFNSLSTYTSVEVADGAPAWNNVQNNTANGIAASVANNGFIYLRWAGDDVSGGGSRDEFGIDNVTVTAVPEPSSFALISMGMGLLYLLRRKRK